MFKHTWTCTANFATNQAAFSHFHKLSSSVSMALDKIAAMRLACSTVRDSSTAKISKYNLNLPRGRTDSLDQLEKLCQYGWFGEAKENHTYKD